MGATFSTPSSSSSPPKIAAKQNPSTTMSSSPSSTSGNPESAVPGSPATPKTLETQTPDQKPTDASAIEEIKQDVDENDEDEEEKGECGFCLFMKGGDCREEFINWEKCIEEAENNKMDIVKTCFQATSALKECMDAHPDYYGPILRAEKAAEEEARKHMEKEAAGAPDSGEEQKASDSGEEQKASDSGEKQAAAGSVEEQQKEASS